jgi:hypothetical protein
VAVRPRTGYAHGLVEVTREHGGGLDEDQDFDSFRIHAGLTLDEMPA